MADTKKVRILGNVKFDGVVLTEYEVYDLPTESADKLIAAGNATTKGIQADSQVRKYTPRKVAVGPDGMRQPNKSVEDTDKINAMEEEGKTVKGVEPKQKKKTVKGKDKTTE